MILTGNLISQEVKLGNISIDPFDSSKVSPNSYDVSLSEEIFFPEDKILSLKTPANYSKIRLPPEGKVFEKGVFAICRSRERISCGEYTPMIHGLSGLARAGVFSHVTGDLFDVGFTGHLTLQVYCILPAMLSPGMPIAQVSFRTVERFEGA